MSMIVDDPSPRIAARVRAERDARGWSMADLAARANVSKAMISKIERGEASPTASVLGRLSGAFGLTLSALVARAEADHMRLRRARDQEVWRDPETDYIRRAVVAGPACAFEVTEVSLPPGAHVAFPRASYVFIRQAIWVLSGTLGFREGACNYTLAAGDSLVLGEPEDCGFTGLGQTPCRYAVIVLKR